MISVFGVLVQLMLYLNRILETYVFECDEMQIIDNLLRLLNCYPSQEVNVKNRLQMEINFLLLSAQCLKTGAYFPFHERTC